MRNRNSAGFTLMELLITVAVVSIVSAIAIYNYGNYIQKANRTDARSTLSRVATSLEKCRSLYSIYNHANCNVAFPVASNEGFYSVTSAFNATGTTFTLTATPVAGQRQATDGDCTTFILDNTGRQTATGADAANCW